MNTTRVRTIVEKEWAEVFKNRLVIVTVAALPLLFAVLPLVVLGTTAGTMSAAGDVTDLPPSFLKACGDLPPFDCLQVYILNQFLVLYMMMPLIIPTSIAAYSIVGEKTTRSLEPLLATPITTEELLIGKGLAAALPAIAGTWGSFLLFALLAPVVGATPGVSAAIFSPTWLTAVFLIGPLMAVLSVNFAVMVSSRVTDPRAAEQIAGVLIVPLMALIFGQIAGLFVINFTLMLGVAATLAVLDIGAIYLGAQVFQREAILTQWK
jgi:ABC-2 type transport system permease protein